MKCIFSRLFDLRAGRFFAAAVCFGLAAWVAPAAAEMNVTAGVERFSWSEYGTNGVKLLDESGPRLAAGFNWLQDGNKGFLLGYSGKIYANDVDYKGQTQGGTAFSTKTNYTGMTHEAVLHYRLDNNAPAGETDHHYLDLVGGLGLDAWTRKIKSNGGVTGYQEQYTIVFLRAGLEMVPLKSGLRVAAGFKYPLSTNERLADYPLSDAAFNLKPQPDLSYYATIGWRFNNPWSVAVEFDSYRFKKSDAVTIYYGGTPSVLEQPESVMEILTIKAGYSF